MICRYMDLEGLWHSLCKRAVSGTRNHRAALPIIAKISIRILKTMKICAELTYNNKIGSCWLINSILFFGKIDIHSSESMAFTKNTYSKREFSVVKDTNCLI